MIMSYTLTIYLHNNHTMYTHHTFTTTTTHAYQEHSTWLVHNRLAPKGFCPLWGEHFAPKQCSSKLYTAMSLAEASQLFMITELLQNITERDRNVVNGTINIRIRRLRGYGLGGMRRGGFRSDRSDLPSMFGFVNVSVT